MAWRIALLGAQDPLGETVLGVLDESPLDIGELMPLACEHPTRPFRAAGVHEET